MQQSPIENATKQIGRPKGLNAGDTRKRDEQIYRLWLMQWSAIEIAESLNLDRASVYRAVERIRKHNSWFNKTARERFADIIDSTRDQVLQTIRESWHMYHSPELANKPETRAVYLARVQNGIKIVTDFVPDADALRIEEEMERLRQVHESIEKTIEELRQSGKISAALPPYPSWNQLA